MTDTNLKLGIIAGGGDLPLRLAEACAVQGRPFHIIGFKHMADPGIEAYRHDWTDIGKAGRTLKLLRDSDCQAVIMAGIVKRPDFSKLSLDLTGTRLLPRVLKAARGGDDKLLRVFVDYFEEQGFTVVGADDVMAALLAPPGVLSRAQPTREMRNDIVHGCKVMEEIGRFDIGQGVVVARGLVLAVEAAEGTDEMLKRCSGLPEHLRGTAEARAGVLVKLAKPGQERRIDLPTIGLATVEGAAAAGLSGIAVEAGGTLIIDRDAVIRRADELGLFIEGVARAAGKSRP